MSRKLRTVRQSVILFYQVRVLTHKAERKDLLTENEIFFSKTVNYRQRRRRF